MYALDYLYATLPADILETEIDTEATTINGLISEMTGTIPEIGYTFDYENLNIIVTKANDLMTEEIFVKVLPKKTEMEDDED